MLTSLFPFHPVDLLSIRRSRMRERETPLLFRPASSNGPARDDWCAQLVFHSLSLYPSPRRDRSREWHAMGTAELFPSLPPFNGLLWRRILGFRLTLAILQPPRYGQDRLTVKSREISFGRVLKLLIPLRFCSRCYAREWIEISEPYFFFSSQTFSLSRNSFRRSEIRHSRRERKLNDSSWDLGLNRIEKT